MHDVWAVFLACLAFEENFGFWQVAEWKSVHWYFAPGAWDIVEIEQDSDWPE